MAVSSAQPSPLVRYLRVERAAEKSILVMLKAAARDLERQISMIENLDSRTVSQRVRLLQLRQAERAVKQRLSSLIDAVGGEIRGFKVKAAESAGQVIADTTKIFSSAGLSTAQVDLLHASVVLGAQKNVDAAIARMIGDSYIPLSSRVYKTQQLINGQVSKIIQDHLARGSSARDLARDVRRFIRPDVRGGVRYAAMRLARTELNNAFHAVSKRSAVESPFVEGMEWHLSGSHPRPDECNDYADHGAYEPDDVPSKPHPNCLCYVTPITPSRDQFLINFRAGRYDDFLDENLGDHAA